MSEQRKQLPKVKFRTNIPITMTLPYGDAKTVPSKYEGQTQYLYTVEIDGDSHALFAPERLHEQLAEVGKGGVAKVTKAEHEGKNGQTYQQFEVEILERGKPVQSKGSTGGAESSAAAPQQGGQGSRPREGGQERLTMLSAAYAACIDEARGVWLNATGAQAENETIHSTAAALFIGLTREGYDLTPFVNSFAESQGRKALRRLVDRTRREPHLAEVRDFFAGRLDPLPTLEHEQRRLYVELREAVRTATEAAAEATPEPEDEEAPTEEPPTEKAAVPSDQIEKIEELAEEVFGAGYVKLLSKMITGVTRRADANLHSLSDDEAKAILRTLESRKARLQTA